MKRMNSNRGITLVELMVVITIIGILSINIYVALKNAPHKARASEFPTVLSSIRQAEIIFEGETGRYSSDLSELDIESTEDSKWFDYSVSATDTSFVATATVKQSFGKAKKGNAATIDQNGKKSANGGLAKYVRNWN
jgi:prepilin-type N-terminal cleavage/methylation domain-containing protein